MSILIIAEKPDAARRIAEALAEKGSLKSYTDENKVTYYEFERKGKKHIVACAVGHLFNLAPVEKGWHYPVFSYTWKPSYEVSKQSAFSKKYFDVVSNLASKASDFIVATDYDTEGCLPYEEKIIVKENGILKIESIGEFSERLFRIYPNKKWGEFDYIEPENVFIPVMDEKFRVKFGKIKKVMKRGGDEKLLQITTELGRRVTVSKNHPFFVLTEFGLNIKRADELKVGDYLPIVKKLPVSGTKISEIDLIDECSKIEGNFYVYGIRNVIKLMPKEMADRLGVKRKTCLGWKFYDRMPLWAYLKLEPKGACREKLKIGVAKSKIKIPAVLKLDSRLGRLLGYYLAEGCLDSSGFIGLYFGPHEKNLVDEVESLFKDIFQIKKIKRRFRKTKGNLGEGFSYEIGTKGKIISCIFHKILNLGSNAHEKRLPKNVFSMPLEFITNLIDAYLLGDGCVFIDSRDKRIILSAASVSKDLIDGLHLILLSLGINTSLVKARTNNIYYLYLGPNEIKKILKLKMVGLLKRNKLIDKLNEFPICLSNPIHLLPKFILEDCKLSRWASHNIQYGERTSIASIVEKTSFIRMILEGDIHFLKIKKIEEIENKDSLYDLETETGNFVHGNGIVTHNSVIGFNVLRFLANRNDAKRMKFSTLTKDELIESYEKASPHIDFGQLEAGLTRHELDWLWGINITRALTLALKNSAQKGFAILSSGRVQSPTLAILLERELEIRKFKPKPFWELELHVKIDGTEAVAAYEKGRIWKKEDADKILQACKGKDAKVKDIKKKKYKQAPPVPFNTTDLQAEAYQQFKFSPQQTMNIAESLYQAGYISYPRSSSQKLPPSINYEKILKALASLPQYKKFAEELLKKEKLVPVEGKREDPAHPAVYATHEVPDLSKLTAQQKKIYDLIARRTLAVFGDEALRETNTVSLDVNGYVFLLVGKRTLEPGWTKIYEPYLKREELILPELKIGQTIKVIKLEELAKETQPPARYSQGSIIKEMEARNLGTRATRAEILQTLYDRGYISGKSIQVTKLGEAVTQALKEYCPRILSEELTRKFEEEMELVYNGKKKREEVVEEAKKTLKEILEEFKLNEKKIGKKLLEALMTKREEERKLGSCPNCKTGELRILRSRLSGKFFVGCSNYPNCKTGYPLPAGAMIQPTGKICEKCGTPIVQVLRKGKRPFRMCLDPKCETKKDWNKKAKK